MHVNVAFEVKYYTRVQKEIVIMTRDTMRLVSSTNVSIARAL